MTDNGVINIHGRDYVTVAKRVEMLHADKDARIISFDSDVISHNPVVIKTTIKIMRNLNGEWVEQIYSGVSAANPSKQIEKQSPYEVAETSSYGRALGFAGYGIIEGIASADEMVKAGATEEQAAEDTAVCPKHKVPMKHFEKGTDEWWSHRLEDGTWCNGKVQKTAKPKDDFEDPAFLNEVDDFDQNR